MTADAPTPDGPPTGSNAMWYWIAVLMVMFMGIVIVMAVIQTHAQ